MSSPKTIYVCSKCDAQSPKWSGRCFECGAWGTVDAESKQEHESNKTKKQENNSFNTKKLIDFNEVKTEDFKRLKLNLNEIDQIFGGGIVQGSISLIGGEPGIGKSTIVLQILQALESHR